MEMTADELITIAREYRRRIGANRREFRLWALVRKDLGKDASYAKYLERRAFLYGQEAKEKEEA